MRKVFLFMLAEKHFKLIEFEPSFVRRTGFLALPDSLELIQKIFD